MSELIRYAVSCTSVYGVFALIVLFLGLALLGITFYKPLHIIVIGLYNIVHTVCCTLQTYNEVRSKISAKTVSVETKLHREK